MLYKRNHDRKTIWSSIHKSQKTIKPVRKAAKLAVYIAMRIIIKNHQTDRMALPDMQ